MAGDRRDGHAAFVADLAAATMVRIQRRQVTEATGLGDAEACQELASLVTNGLAR
ncbi:hypothetical protein ACWDUM_27730 [Rhodococcus sp. NPDC003322]